MNVENLNLVVIYSCRILLSRGMKGNDFFFSLLSDGIDILEGDENINVAF